MISPKLFSNPIGSGARRALKTIAIIAAICGVLFFYLNRFSFMSSQALKQKMPFKTYCIGRLAIDLPTDATIRWGDQSINYIKMTSESLRSSSTEVVDFHLEKRSKELASLPSSNDNAIAHSERLNNPYGKLFEYYSDKDYESEFQTQALFAAGNRLITLTDTNYLQGNEPSSPDYDHPNGKARANVIQLASFISAIPTSLPEANGGSCVSDVFIRGSNIIKEDIDVTAEFSGIEFSINTVADAKEAIKPSDGTMFERFALLPVAMISGLEEKRLRFRKRTINGIWHSEEFGSAGKNVSDHLTYSFTLEANQPKAGLTTPELTIEMKASPEDHSQDEILAIWDTIIDSIRPRPAGLTSQ